MPKFVHIDIAADDPERAAAFYRSVFDWKVEKLKGPISYWLVAAADEAGGIGAGIGKRQQDWQGAVPTIEVDSVDEYERRIKAAGGMIVAPKIYIPGVGDLLTFRDSEGNVFA